MTDAILRLKIVLIDTEPPIRRRLEVLPWAGSAPSPDMFDGP
jgi:hypothetical protein